MTTLSRRAFHRLLATAPAFGLAERLAAAAPPAGDAGISPSIGGYTLTERDRAEAEEFLRRHRLSAEAVDAVPLADDIPPASPSLPACTPAHPRSGA